MINEKLVKGTRICGRTIINIALWLLSITCIFPIVWMIYSSLKTQKEFAIDIISLPQKPAFSNYVQAITEGNLGTYFMNSVYYTVISVLIAVILSFVIGYILSRFKFRGRTFIYYFFLAGMLIPIYALLIPIFLEFKAFGLLNKRITLILPYIAFALPVGVFLVESYVKAIPWEMEEAACIDGCRFGQTMSRIILPMCQPVLSTTAILSFLNTWNEFPLALVLIRSNRLKTMPLGVTNFVGTYTENYTLMLAALSISALPVIIVYLLFYSKVMNGMVSGAVKG